MAVIQIHELPEKTSAMTSGDMIPTDDGTNTKAVDFDLVAKSVIEDYEGSELAGTIQSVQSAINSREAVDSNGTYTQLVSGIYYVKKHGWVNISAYKTGTTLSAGSWTLIATLPEGYRPSATIYSGTVVGNGGQYSAYVRVQADGGIYLYCNTAINSVLAIFNVTFAVAEEE